VTRLDRPRRVAILAAMVPELRPIVRALALRPMPLDGARAYSGGRGGIEIVAAVTSMGTRAATDVTDRLLEAASVDHVLVVGICGGIDRRLSIGALVQPETVLDEASGTSYRPAPLGAVAPAGVLMTTDVLHNDPAETAELARRGIVAVDMETAAIGAISDARGIPWSVFRAISDWAGDPDLDAEIVGMSRPDGTPDPRAILRFLMRHPLRIPKLAKLGAGMRVAVERSTRAALAALGEI
jgi:adenosylhomocysteine nucleosidase